MASNNVLSADNQQERLQQLNPWYIAGFVDGEGSFHIALYKDVRMRTNLKIIPEFHVSQNEESRSVLEELRKILQCGNIKVNHRGNNSDSTHVLVVRNRYDLKEKVIPFFRKYQLRTLKAKDFNYFSKVVEMMLEGRHQTTEGAKQIIEIAYHMNGGGKRRKVKKVDLIKVVESSETIRETT